MKKHTIEIDAQVKGKNDVEDLSGATEDLTKSYKELSTIQIKNTVITEAQSVRLQAFANSLGDAMTQLRGWAFEQVQTGAKTKAGAVILRVLAGRLLGISPIIAGITAAFILYRKAVASANAYLEANIEAQDKMRKQQTAVTAWANVWSDVNVWFGEFFHSFKDFWSFAKNIAGKGLLTLLGLEDYVFEADKAIEVQQRLNTEWEKTANVIQKLNYESTDLQKIIHDETKTQQERIIAAGQWNLKQQEILKLQRKRIEDEIFLNKQSEVQNDVTRNSLYKLQGQLDANDRELVVLNRTQVENIQTINTKKEKIKELTDAYDPYLDVLAKRQALYEKEFAARKELNRLTNEGKDISKDILDNNELLDEEDKKTDDRLIEKYDRENAYKDFLDKNLQDMGGMWGDYFATLQQFYSDDVKFSELSNEQKLSMIAGTAQATLGMASMLISQLGAAASDDFETQKKYKIAGATVDTLQGAVSAFMSAQSLPQPYGAILGAVLAAGTLAMGFANINKIKSTTADSATTGGAVSTPSAPNVSAPSLSLISPATQGESNISDQLGVTQEPINAYVVSTDMSSQQQLDRRIETQATI
jgi:hypothetical protein